MDEKNMIKISKNCKNCGRRLFDKISPASGYVKIKCPKCGEENTVNLALRRKLYFRMAKSA